MEGALLIALDKCEMCNSAEKWGIVLRIDKHQVFICEDCLKGLLLKIRDIKGAKSGKRTISPI